MASKCSVNPQIWHDGQLTDSKAFARLWANAKSVYTDSVEARTKAKEEYFALFEPKFLDRNGDWNLLYKYDNNLMTDQDRAVFESAYNSDIEALRSSIKIELDSNGEPATDTQNSEPFSLPYHENTKSKYLSDDDQFAMNRLFAGIIVSTFTKEGKINLADIKFSDLANNLTIKGSVIDSLKEILKKNKNKNLKTIIEYLEQDEKEVWDMFVGYFTKKYNIRIEDISEYEINENPEDELPQETIETAEITKRFDDTAQLKMDVTLTTAAEIKFELAKCVHSNTKLLVPFVTESLGIRKGKPTVIKKTEYHGSNQKFDINVPFDVDDIWNQILSINHDSINHDQVIASLEYLSDVWYGGALVTFTDRLKNDPEFYNLFYRTAKLAIVDNVTLTVDKDMEVASAAYFDIITNNRNSKADRYAYNIILNNLENTAKLHSHDLSDIFDAIKMYNSSNKLSTKLESIIRHARIIGVPMTESSVAYMVRSNTNLRPGILNFANSIKYAQGIERDGYEKQLDVIREKLISISSVIFKAYGVDYSKIEKKDAAGVTFNKVDKSVKLKINKAVRGSIEDLAKIIKIDFSGMTSMSYFNAKFDREQSPQYNSFLTDNWNGYTSLGDDAVSKDFITKKFEDYFKDPRLKFDNLLWDTDDKGQEGMFEVNYDKQGNLIPIPRMEVIRKLQLIQLSGAKYFNSNSGEGYREIKDDNWNLVESIANINGYYLIPSSDSGRIFGIKRKFEHFESAFHFESIADNGEIVFGHLLQYDADTEINELSPVVKDSRLYKYFLNNIKQEFKDIQLTFAKIYDVEEYKTTKKLVVRPEYLTESGKAGLLQRIEIGSVDGVPTLIKDNKPTGSVFSKSNLLYVEAGKSFTLKNIVEDGAYDSMSWDYIQEILYADIESLPRHLETFVDIFFANWLYNNQKNTAEALKYVKDDIVNAKRKRSNGEKLESEFAENLEAEIKKNSLVPIPKAREGVSQADIQDWSFNITALNLFLNNHFNTVAFGNLMFGNVTEFKDMVDWNKRVNQTIRNGASTPSTNTYNMMVCEDISLKSNMLDLFDKYKNGTPDQLASVRTKYKDLIVTSNAIDFITDEEYIKRLKANGTYDRYKDIIDAIEAKDADGKYLPFNPEKYLYLIEQLKYFSYTRKLVGDRVVSIQNKNSTVVLFKRFVKGTEKEILYNFMIQNGIDDINTSEGHKLGGVTPLKLHKEDGSLNWGIMKFDKEFVNKHAISLSYKDLRTQLDVVPHLENEENTIATQLIKKTLDNVIADATYTIGGKSFKGRTGKKDFSKMGAQEIYQHTLSAKAEASAFNLLAEFGAVKDGKIQTADNGNTILVDTKKVARILEKYFIENQDDLNIIKAVRVNPDGTTNLPYHHPSLLKLIESVLEAKITNAVTRQRIKGSHVPIQPDMFNAPTKFVHESTNQDTHVTYTREFLKDATARGSRKLLSEYTKDGVYHPAEIVVNPFDKRFYREEFLMDDGSGRIDINKIQAKDPKILTVFGTRIPHEGDQSAFTAKIVGFLQTGGSTAVTPDHLIARTGWDFDIDTIYLYHYEYNNKFEVLNAFNKDDSHYQNRLDDYIKTHYPENYLANAKKLGYESFKLYQELDEIKNQYKAILEGFTDEHFKIKLKNVEDAISRALKSRDEMESGERAHTNFELEEVYGRIGAYSSELSRLLTISKGQLIRKFGGPSHKDILKSSLERDVKLANIKARIEANKKENAEYLEPFKAFKKSKIDEFNKFDTIQQATEAEKNNIILDTLIAFHSHPTNFEDREKPNEMDHINRASNYVNSLLGFNTKNAHPTNFADKLFFRNLNMNVGTLKAYSVNYDNLLAVLNVIGAENVDHKVPATMTFDQVFGYDSSNSINTIVKKFDDAFGEDNYTIDWDAKKVHIVNIGFIGNNFVRDGRDIQGQKITEQRSELTTNILDAVKKLMVNLNKDTLSIFAYLASTPLSYYTDIHQPGKPEVNRFIYPSLFISQPIIQELSKSVVANNRFGDNKFSSFSEAQIRAKYMKQLIEHVFTMGFEEFVDDLSKTYSMSIEEEDSILKNDPEFDVTEHNESRRAFYRDTFEAIQDYKKSGRTNEISGEVLNEFLKYNSIPEINSEPHTLEVLKADIEYGVTGSTDPDYKAYEDANFIISQLSVLNYYSLVDKASADVSKMTGIFNTDKLGAGPTSATTNRLLNNIVRFEKNFDGFDSFLKRKFKDSNEEYKRIISDVQSSLHSKVSIREKVQYLDSIYDEYEFTKTTSAIRAFDGKSVTASVFGDLFTSNNPSYLDSSYPYLKAQLMWTNILSTKVYNNIMLSENHEIKALLNKTLASLNSINDERLRYKLLMYFMNRNISQLDFFRNTDMSQILTVATIGTEDYQVTHNGKVYDRTRKVYNIPKFEASDMYNADMEGNFNTIQTSSFAKLTLANQILIAKRAGTNNEFLSRITLNMSEDSIENSGYISLSVSDNDKNINQARSQFKHMYNSKNPYDVMVAENIIRYAFVTNGLQFGSSISKYLPTDIYFDPNETVARNNDLYKIKTVLENIKNMPTNDSIDAEYMMAIHKSNWNNSHVNPVMDKTYYFNKEGKRAVNDNRPTWEGKASTSKDIHTDIESTLLNHIIVEHRSKIDDSQYYNSEYLTKEINVGANTKRVLYKRYPSVLGKYYLYYPINRTLSFEYNNTVVSELKAMPNDIINPIIQPEEVYLNLINSMSIQKGANKTKSANQTKSDIAYSSALIALANESDVVLYIGESNTHEAKVVSNMIDKSKTKIVSEKDFIGKTIKFGKKGSPVKVTIISSTKLESSVSDLNSALVRNLNSNNVSEISTLLSKSVSKDVFDSNIGKILAQSSDITIKKNIVELTDSDVQESNSFEVEYAETSADTIAISMMNLIKKSEGEILTIAARLHRALEHTTTVNINELTKIVNEAANIVANIDPLNPKMGVINTVLQTNSVLFDFVENKISRMMDDISSTDVRMFEDDANYEQMVKYSAMLESTNNYLHVAESIINLPIFHAEDLDKLEGIEFDVLSSYNEAVLTLNLHQKVLTDYRNQINAAVKDYFAINIISRTRNENYYESLHQHALNHIIEEGFSPEDIIGVKRITREDLDSVIEKMLNRNEDMSWIAARLDSARDTYVTLPDILGKMYAETLYKSHAQAAQKTRRFKDILAKVTKNTDKEFSESREQWFLDNFVDEEGYLISEFDNKGFKATYSAALDNLEIMRGKYRTAIQNKDKEGQKAIKSEIDKITRQIKEMRIEEEILPGTDEYEKHRQADALIPTNHKKAYERNNRIRMFNTDKKGFRVFKSIPAPKYASKAYTALSDENKQFLLDLKLILSDITKDVFPTFELDETFIPYLFKPTKEGEVKRLFGIAKVGRDTAFTNILGERQYYVEASMMRAPSINDVVEWKDLVRGERETKQAFEKRVVEFVNAKREATDKFDSFADILKYNDDIKNKAKMKSRTLRNFDIGNLVQNYIHEMNTVNIVKEFEPSYRLALIVLGSPEFKASMKTASGKTIYDKVKSTITGQHENIMKAGKETEIYGRVVAMSNALYNVSRTNTKTDVALSAVLKYTSLGTMGFNFRSGVKNVLIGYTNIMNEALSKEFVNPKQIFAATNTFRAALPHIIKDAGKDRTENRTAGLIKYFGMLFEDHSDAGTDNSASFVGKGLKMFDNAAYIALNSGEIFMQFNMLLAMLQSHRLVAGGYMSEADYVSDRRLKALESVLSPEDFSELTIHVNKEKADNKNLTNYVDYIGKWVSARSLNFSPELRAAIKKSITETNAAAREEFVAFPTLDSQFELKDGAIQIIEDSQLTGRVASEFMNTVRAVNHSIHGIYNTIDRNVLQDSLIGELFMQFRKWMRPSFVRWFGAKFGKTSFSEATGTYRGGSFSDFAKFIYMPASRALDNSKDSINPTVDAVRAIAAGYIDFLTNVKYYYHLLPTNQKANVNRAITQIMAMAVSTTLLYATYALIGGDDEKRKSWVVSSVLYQLSSMQTELWETTPAGWLTFYLRSKRNIMPAERSLTDLGSFFYYAILYPFQSENQRTYQSGIYRGESKVEVKLKKAVPLVRQIQTEQHLSNTVNYYQIYNPVINIIGTDWGSSSK